MHFFLGTLRVTIESFTKNCKQDKGQHKNHSCLVAGSDFPSFFLFFISSIFSSFFLTLSIHVSLFSLYFFYFMLFFLCNLHNDVMF